MGATVSFQCNRSMAFSVCTLSKNRFLVPLSSFAPQRQIDPSRGRKKIALAHLGLNDKDDNCVDQKPRTTQRISGYKRALLRKFGKTIALFATLLCGPMASIPSARRIVGSTANAASSSVTAPSPSAPSAADDASAYKFEDFKGMEGQLSLAPGAVAEEYDEILAKIEVEGRKALEDGNDAQKQSAISISDSGGPGDGDSASSSTSSRETKGGRSASKRAQRKKQKESQMSEWELDEFGYDADSDNDLDKGVMSFSGSSKIASSNKLSPSKKSKTSAGDSTEGGKAGNVVMIDKMAFSNYKTPLVQEEKIKTIKKGSVYCLLPFATILTIRGQVRAYRERKWVQKGLAIMEEERQNYLEEKKKKKEGNKDDDDGEDDDDDDESDGNDDDSGE